MSRAPTAGGPAVDECPIGQSLADQFVRIDPEDWHDVWLVGDVHGCRETFERLLGVISPGPSELVVVAGDLIGNGPDSAGVCRIVRDLEHVRSVRGAAEQRLAEGRATVEGLADADERFLESLPLAVGVGDALLVHGGVDHRRPLVDHDAEALLTTGSLDGGDDRPFWFERRTSGRRIFFGHTVLAEPFATPWAVGLDTGCVYGGDLTAYRWSTKDFVSVAARTAHADPDDAPVVVPRDPRKSVVA